MKTLQSRNNEITACPIIIREAHINIGIIGECLPINARICKRIWKRFIVIHI